MGSRVGVMKQAAQRVGVTVEEYERRVAAGLKWCTACKAWQPRSEFVVDRSRSDGLRARCLGAGRGRPRGHRDADKEAARQLVGRFVHEGSMPHPNRLPCTDCGHEWSEGERRHEYDHYLGYGYALAVQAVCTLCHADREKARRADG